MQKKYGRLVVPINKALGHPTSPEVWGSFLCGEHISLGFEKIRFNSVFKILRQLKGLFPFISLGLGRKISGTLKDFPKLNKKTWVDKPNVEEIGVPYYSYTNEHFEAMKEFSEDKDLNKLRKKLDRFFQSNMFKVSSKTKEIVENNDSTDVVFAYIHFPDLYHHFWFSDLERIREHYFELSKFFVKIKNIVGDTHIFIISDHGFNLDTQEHGDFGFISSNREVELPTDIIEFGKRLFKEVEITNISRSSGKAQDKETEQIIRKLRDMGYI
jgi:hypothetical protein